jgi:hypothetical protein
VPRATTDWWIRWRRSIDGASRLGRSTHGTREVAKDRARAAGD